jgi:hypothetical protein
MRRVLVITLLFASLTADAQSPPNRPTRVFVSGHSLTDLPMPAYLERIAGSLGTPLDWNRQYMVGSAIKHRARGRGNETGWAGYSMGDNKSGQGLDVVRELRTNPYDMLLITEQHGVIDSLLSHDAVRHLRHYHDRFIDGNARGRTWFYEPWLGIPGRKELGRWIDYERTSAPLWQCIVTRVNRSLEAEGRGDRISSLPVGLALAELMESAARGAVEGVSGATPEDAIHRIFHDNVHLTPLGAYYVSLATYAGMFDRSPVGAWVPEGVSAVQAASLQRVAGAAMSRLRAERKALAPEPCSALLRGPFVGTYLAHFRDDYWTQQQGNALRLTWRRWKGEMRTRWTLWREDPLAWARTDRGYWFPPP